MAKITKIFISGKIGNVVSYERGGKAFLRVLPEEVRQSKATKRSAKNFGKAMRIAKFLRWEIADLFPQGEGRYAEYKLNNAVAQWLPGRNSNDDDEAPALFSLPLCKKGLLSQRLKKPVTVDWTVDGVVILLIPALNLLTDIAAPVHTKLLHWTISVAGSSISHPVNTDTHTVEFDMDYTDTPLPAEQIALPFSIKPGSINLLGVSIRYMALEKNRLKRITKPGWMPAAIASGFYQP